MKISDKIANEMMILTA